MKYLFIIYLFFYYSCFLSGQNQQHKWQNLTAFEHITGILEKEDFLYVSSNGGLCIWNQLTGKKTFYNQTNTSFPDNHIYHIYMSSDQTLWLSFYKEVGTFKNGVYQKVIEDEIGIVKEGTDGTIHIAGAHYLFVQNKASQWDKYKYPGLVYRAVGMVFKDTKVYLAFEQPRYPFSGILVWENGEWLTFRERVDWDKKEYYYRFTEDRATIFQTEKDDFWVLTNFINYQLKNGESTDFFPHKGIDSLSEYMSGYPYEPQVAGLSDSGSSFYYTLFHRDKGYIVHYKDKQTFAYHTVYEGDSSFNITAFYALDANRFLVGTRNKNLWEWSPDGNKLKPISIKPSPLNQNCIYKILRHKKTMFVATKKEYYGHDGYQLYEVKNKKWRNILLLKNAPLSYNDLEIDKNGHIWIGLGHQLYQWNNEKWIVYPIPASLDEYDVIGEISVYRGFPVWCQTKNYVWRLNRSGKWTLFSKKDYGDFLIMDVQAGKKGQVCLSACSAFIYYDGEHWELIEDTIGTCKAIRMDSRSIIYGIGKRSRTMEMMMLKNKKILYPDYPIPAWYASILYNDRDNYIWFLSKIGLVKIKEEQIWVWDEKRSDFLPSFITSIARDPKGNLWMGTRKFGIFIYDKKYLKKVFRKRKQD